MKGKDLGGETEHDHSLAHPLITVDHRMVKEGHLQFKDFAAPMKHQNIDSHPTTHSQNVRFSPEIISKMKTFLQKPQWVQFQYGNDKAWGWGGEEAPWTLQASPPHPQDFIPESVLQTRGAIFQCATSCLSGTSAFPPVG